MIFCRRIDDWERRVVIGLVASGGFTATELMVTIAIAGVLAMIAAPNLMDMKASQVLNAAARDIHSSFQMARMTAIKECCNVRVVFSTESNGSYVIFRDTDNDGAQDTDEPVIRSRHFEKPLSLSYIHFSSNDAACLNSRGFASASYGHVVVKHENEKTKKITLAPSGYSHIN
ncbi:MAG: hypothetical protein CSA22_06990 [Deltaproteobacteria bacterium]|nr:MAG: hypothetical protein CSA22_06990 [Deltaproteobacteria bacterium]